MFTNQNELYTCCRDSAIFCSVTHSKGSDWWTWPALVLPVAKIPQSPVALYTPLYGSLYAFRFYTLQRFRNFSCMLFLNCLHFMPVWVFHIIHFNVTHVTALHAMGCSWLVVYDWVHSCMLAGLYQIGLFVYSAMYVWQKELKAHVSHDFSFTFCWYC